MINSSQNREGYIRNPWSKENDGIHITAFFKRIEKDAGKRSGCYYEIYQKMCLDSLLDALHTLDRLNPKDAQFVRDTAKDHGYDLSDKGVGAAMQDFDIVMSEIYKEQL